MASVTGQADRVERGGDSFGILGIATTDAPNNITGVTGIVGTPDSVQTWRDRVDALGTFSTAAVSGIVPDDQGHFVARTSFGFLAGTDPKFGQHAGVYGESDQLGVFGNSDADAGTGVMGRSVGPMSVGVRGETLNGVGVQGRSFGSGVAGRFIGDVEVTGDIRMVNADVAEDFTVVEAVDPGTVMVIEDGGELTECRLAYDKRVAGVVSGASGYRPAIVLDRQSALSDRAAVALVGKTYCKVDATYSAIETGDLLTTSPTPGHAMKASEPSRAFGTVIGKALRPLQGGQGLIPILVALQ